MTVTLVGAACHHHLEIELAPGIARPFVFLTLLDLAPSVLGSCGFDLSVGGLVCYQCKCVEVG